MRRLTLVLTAFALGAAACTSGSTTSTSSTTSAPPTSPSTSPPTSPPPVAPGELPITLTGFGTLPAIALLGDSPAYAGPATPRSLDGVDISPAAKHMLDAATVKVIEQQGFAIVPGQNRLFSGLYEGIVYDGGGTVYVTTDVAFHAWHLVFDKVLRSLEQEVLLPKLQTLATQLAADAHQQAVDLKDTPMATAAVQIDRLLQTELALLGVATPSDPVVQKELALIEGQAGPAKSPILGTTIDYGLFTPRGHYTRSPELTRFFLGMTLLGQAPFAIEGATTDELRGAVLAARLLSPAGLGSPETVQAWRDIYEPTAFLVGAADDYTPLELADALTKAAPRGLADPASLTDADLQAMRTALLASHEVRIDPEHASMRLMGVRFVLDSWILDQLIYPSVGTDTDPRLMPSTLDLASVFGSSLADAIQRKGGQYDFLHYGSQVKAMRHAVATRPARSWGGTVYDAWLWSLQPLWTPHGKAYPDMMRTPAWAAKDLQSGAGTYAELKHDTILYAKQFAAEGGYPGPAYRPRNWVEPEPVAFQRLGATAALMRRGLADRGLLTKEADTLLGNLVGELGDFGRIATDELAGEPITKADNDLLGSFGGWMEQLWFATADQGPGGSSEMDQDSAIVADIGRGGDEVLEIATGRVDTILILVPDDRGGFQLAIGGVYAFYEFTQPVSDRLDDTTWRQMLSDGSQPDRPAWEGVFLAG